MKKQFIQQYSYGKNVFQAISVQEFTETNLAAAELFHMFTQFNN